MPNFEYDFSNDDYQLITDGDNNVIALEDNQYLRISIFTETNFNQPYSYFNSATNQTEKAIFYSSVSPTAKTINISSFTNQNSVITTRQVGGIDGEFNDFPIYQTVNSIDDSISMYLKPNEILSKNQFPQGGYRIKVDVLQQLNPVIVSDSNDLQYIGDVFEFIVKQISPSRREVRLKLLNNNLSNNPTQNSWIINDIEQQLNSYTADYKFEQMLNVGDGGHIPITNFHFDAVTDGKENQSIILRLYKPLPLQITNLKTITIEKEVMISQTTDIFYFSEITPLQRGTGLNPDNIENWINIDEDNNNFENYNEISASLTDTSLQQFTSGSSHYYPNLNIDYTKFENHTFFGSAKKKLENFKSKVETIQGHYSEISKSLSVSSSMDDDSNAVIQLRKDLFNKVNTEINSFTPYEHFLYYDGQQQSSASAPGVGRNYAETVPVSTRDNMTQINGGDGFDVVYQHSNKNRGNDKYIGLFVHKYFLQNKPFFNHSGSIYLSFLMKADSGSQTTGNQGVLWENRQNNHGSSADFKDGVNFPRDTKFRETLLNPPRTASAYQRYVFHTSHSYFAPSAEVDFDLSKITNFNTNSPHIEILSGSTKSVTNKIKDLSGKYQNYTTVVTQSAVPFKGSVMPSGELFRIFHKNSLNVGLQGYMNFDDEISGSDVTDDMMLRTAAEGSGTLDNPGPPAGHTSPLTSVTVTSGLEFHNRKYGNSVQFTSESRHELDFDDDKFNFNKDTLGFTLSIWAKRFHPYSASKDGVASADGYNADAVGQHDPNSSHNLIGRGSTSNSYGITYNQAGNSISAGVRGLGGGAATTQETITHTMPDDLLDWHHIAFTFQSGSATGLKLYVDGVLEGQNTTLGANYKISGSNDFSASNYATEPLTVGGNEIVGGNNVHFSGFLQYPRVYDRTLDADEIKQLYLTPDGISNSKITDVKITFRNPTNAQPFSNLYHTSSAEWTSWYDSSIIEAEKFDNNNIHSLENNLPLYIQESSEFNDLKDFLSLQGEQYDVIRNHIDSLGTIHTRGYGKLDSPPENIFPILLENLGYQAINPFSGSLEESLGSYLSGVTSIDDIKNNTWRKTLNNLIYIYKTKGTENSVRGLLNTYGYPPDVLPMREFGGSPTSEASDDLDLVPTSTTWDGPPSQTPLDTDLSNTDGNVNFSTTNKIINNYMFNNNPNRTLNLDWHMNDANLNTIEFIYKHTQTTNTQTILHSSGSGNEDLWDLRLLPSSDGASSSFEFRLNNSLTGSLPIATNALSMSTNYSRITDGQLWNVMLQRMTSSNSTNIINEYRLHVSLQEDESIKTYNYATMSVSGGLPTDSNNIANKNFIGSGSRHPLSSSNLVVGETFSGSLSQIKGWSTALSRSKFRQHTFNKLSSVGNTINSHEKELIYHFRLNENFTTASISSSTQIMTIKDSSPKTTFSKDYSFQKSGSFFTSSLVYGVDNIKQVVLGTQGSNQDFNNKNKIILNPPIRALGNLNPTTKTAVSTDDNLIKTSTKLDLDKSVTNTVNEHILNRIDNFNFTKFYGDPKYYFSSSYIEFDNLRKDLFTSFPIEVDINKFIKTHENIFNDSISEGLKSIVPARSTLSDKNSGFGVTIKQNILEKNKYEHKKHSVEVNPNTATGSIVFVENTEFKQKSLSSNVELPHSSSLSLGNAYITNAGYVHSPSLQPDGVTGSIDFPKSGSAVSVNKNIIFDTVKIEFPHSSSISMGSSYQTESVNNVSITPNFLQLGGVTASIVFPHSSSIDFITTHHNKSFENIHDSWGRGVNDTHFINYAAGTGSNNDYNVGHIDTRNVFHMIGDTEYYSSSFGKASDFSDEDRFYNRLQITENLPNNIEYNSFIGGNPGVQAGRMMGKTRYFHTGSDGSILTLPSNHITKFSNPFKDTMYLGAQNTNPGFFPKTSMNDLDVDHSTSSFYRIKVTGGENQIMINSSGTPSVGPDGDISYG